MPIDAVRILPELLQRRILIIDGAMGTMIQRYKLQEADYRGERFKDHAKDIKGNNEMLQLVKPEVLREIHAQYLAAGADIIETNTFGATSVAQDDYGLGHLAREMNVAAARLARGLADGRLVVTVAPDGAAGLASSARATYSNLVAAVAIAVAQAW